MGKKISLYVVAKKEVFLLFVFMFLVSATSFIFGIKVGKEHAYRESGIIEQDQKRIKMLSAENRESLEQNTQESLEEDMGSLHDRLEEAIKRQMVDMSEEETSPPPPQEVEAEETPQPESSPPTTVSGAKKYTIQLGSYRSRKDAETFAQGFIVRGYQTIIREVAIPSKGTWFRVSLGTFDSTDDAKKYIEQEESLFQGEDYIIRTLL